MVERLTSFHDLERNLTMAQTRRQPIHRNNIAESPSGASVCLRALKDGHLTAISMSLHQDSIEARR